MEYDLLNVPDAVEQRRHKLKRTVQAPNLLELKMDYLKTTIEF